MRPGPGPGHQGVSDLHGKELRRSCKVPQNCIGLPRFRNICMAYRIVDFTSSARHAFQSVPGPTPWLP
eukprot:5548454-Alexandrium_andersonii.AAC.1